MTTILFTFIISAVLALILGFLLGFFKKVFHVEVDPTVAKIRECLPGGNCGGCGYPGCDGFAAACAAGKAPADGCTAGGVATAKAIGKILGVETNAVQKIAVLACQGSCDKALAKGVYTGVSSCAGAKIAINGTKFCSWGCIGFGDCVEVCKFDAIKIGEDGLPHIDREKCTGCGLCVKTCPQKILSTMNAETKGAFVGCSNKNPNKTQILKLCKTGCIKCGKCEKLCKEEAIHLVDLIPVVDYAKCTACGDCVNGCPTKVLSLI